MLGSLNCSVLKWFERDCHQKATKVFSLAFPDLLNAEEYALIGNHIDVEKRFNQPIQPQANALKNKDVCLNGFTESAIHHHFDRVIFRLQYGCWGKVNLS